MEINEYQNLASATCLPHVEYEPLYHLLGLISEVAEYADTFTSSSGEVADILDLVAIVGSMAARTKRDIRDSGMSYENEHITNEFSKGELGDIFWYLSQLARVDGVTLEEVAQGNIHKLQRRKANGTLTGSGDKR